MKSGKRAKKTWWRAGSPKRVAAILQTDAAKARQSPNDFATFCFTDPAGRRLRQAALHRDLQAFLDRHPRALIELPRDHGKSVQACVRVLWELGREPGLRVVLACASEALAAQRCRFLRDAVTTNERLRLVFPQLRPARPWRANAFTIRRPAEVIGPSVAAVGVGAASTGRRAPYMDTDLAARLTSGSKASATKSPNIISTIAASPHRARPQATPVIPASLIGVVSTRSG